MYHMEAYMLEMLDEEEGTLWDIAYISLKEQKEGTVKIEESNEVGMPIPQLETKPDFLAQKLLSITGMPSIEVLLKEPLTQQKPNRGMVLYLTFQLARNFCRIEVII